MSRPQLERILEIDRRIRNGEFPNAESLSVDLEVGRRVIFNDRKFLLERLRAPLAFDRTRRGWFYSEEAWVLPATMVTQGELLAFFLSVEVARRNMGGALEDALASAVAKIARSLPEAVEVEMEGLRACYSFATPSCVNADDRTLLELREAINRRRAIEIFYHALSSNTRGTRTVHPHHLHHAHGDWYLLAFDRKHSSMRTFHVGRIESYRLLDEFFVRDAGFDSTQWNRAAFITEMTGAPCEIAIRFDAHQARYVRERIFHETQTLEEQSDRGVLLRFLSGGLGEVQRWVLQYGAHAEVLSPPELRQTVQEEIRRMTQVYEEDDD